MFKICLHNWVKMEREPTREYLDYSGFKVGVFKCFCLKCGKMKYKKFI